MITDEVPPPQREHKENVKRQQAQMRPTAVSARGSGAVLCRQQGCGGGRRDNAGNAATVKVVKCVKEQL